MTSGRNEMIPADDRTGTGGKLREDEAHKLSPHQLPDDPFARILKGSGVPDQRFFRTNYDLETTEGKRRLVMARNSEAKSTDALINTVITVVAATSYPGIKSEEDGEQR